MFGLSNYCLKLYLSFSENAERPIKVCVEIPGKFIYTLIVNDH